MPLMANLDITLLIDLFSIYSYRQLSNNSSKTEGRKEGRRREKKCPKERWVAVM